MKIRRIIAEDIEKKLFEGQKAVILYGARQVGKTTLVKDLLKGRKEKTLSVNADEQKYIGILQSRDSQKFASLVAGYDVFFLDEAQRVPDIGINLKILIDAFPDLKIIVTGSSSFDLANMIREPLTGRTWTYRLFPISFLELKQQHSPFELEAFREQCMIYGSYPDIFNLPNAADKKKYLEELSTSYLYKDVLELSSIKHSRKIHDLLRLLAFQIGKEVSLSELGNKLGMGKDTVANYIDLLEKSFVLFRLSGFNRNLRKEVTKMDKIYFYDLGIRNILIDNVKPLSERDDTGQLWENFCVVERLKKLSYQNTSASTYFWRTYTGAEIDYVEEREGKLHGYEIKYKKNTAKAPQTWKDTYPNSDFRVVNTENYLDFIA